MIKCSNSCDDIMIDVMLEVTAPEFVNIHKQYMKSRKGVKNYDWYINDKDNLVDIINVNQNVYEKYNYFKYRDQFEKSNLYSINDKDDDVVEVEYQCDLVVQGYKCSNCNEIISEHINNVNNRIYNTKSNKRWVCAGIT